MTTVTSVNVGLPADVDWHGRTVHTGIWKYPVVGPRLVKRLNIDGDGQGDLGGHGGVYRAVLVYQQASYRHWQQHLDRHDLRPGHFGENFTVNGLPDDEVCVGDRYRIGHAEFEVTQPRVTCYRLGIRFDRPELPNLLVAHRRPGFYLRVVTEGHVQAGDEIELLQRGQHELTIAELDGLLYLPDPDRSRVLLAADHPALSPGWQQSFRDMAQAAEAGTAGIPAPVTGPAWPGFRSLTVSRIVHETVDVRSVHLAAPAAASLPRPLPGQFLTVRLPDDAGAAAVRSYSLSSAPDSPTYRISIKRAEHGLVSRRIHTGLHVGATLDVAAPRGEFVLPTNDDEPIVLVSAGIGITPVLAMLHDLAARRSAQRVWWLHTARDVHHYAFADEVRDLLAQLPNAHARTFLTTAATDSPAWNDTVTARMTSDTLGDLGVPPSARVYLCGPEAFMTDLRVVFTGLGISAAQIRTELFGTLAPTNPGIVDGRATTPHAPDARPGEGPSITFARSGLTARWSPTRYNTLLDLAEACDVPTRWSCRSGVCHTCTTAVLAGTAGYTTDPLQPPAADQVLLCCAAPTSEMVLDL